MIALHLCPSIRFSNSKLPPDVCTNDEIKGMLELHEDIDFSQTLSDRCFSTTEICCFQERCCIVVYIYRIYIGTFSSQSGKNK